MLIPEITINIDAAELYAQAKKMLSLTSRSVEDEFEIQMRGAVRTLFTIIPPAGSGQDGAGRKSATQARKSGFSRITADLRGGGMGRGRRRAGVFTVLADGIVNSALESGVYATDNVRLWTTKDGRVYGTQKHFFRPNASMGEMRAQHKKFYKNGQMSRAGTYTRDIARWKWIDQMVVRKSTYLQYEKLQHAKVGLYAAGYVPWAKAVGMKQVPAYIKRHPGSHGSAQLDKRAGVVRFTAVNRFSMRDEADVARRVQWAFEVQANKMRRQIPYLIKRNARQAGLRMD